MGQGFTGSQGGSFLAPFAPGSDAFPAFAGWPPALAFPLPFEWALA